HSALQIAHVVETKSGEDRGGGSAADADAADGDEVAPLELLEFLNAARKFLERNSDRTLDMAEFAAKLLFLAHVDEDRRIGAFELRHQIVGFELTDLVKLGQGRELQLGGFDFALVGLQNLLDAIRQRHTEV